MYRRNHLFVRSLFLALILLFLPSFITAAPPQITDIQPPNAIPGQYIRITGSGFSESSGFSNTTRVFFLQNELRTFSDTISSGTEAWVRLPASASDIEGNPYPLVPGPATIKISNGANTSLPFSYTVGSERAAPVARSLFPAVPSPGQRTFVAVDGLTGYATTTWGDRFEIRQGESLFYARAEPTGNTGEPASRVNQGSQLRSAGDQPASDELTSTMDPGSSVGGGIISLPADLVPGPAAIRAGYQSGTDTFLWGPSLSFMVASSPSPLTLLEPFRDSIPRGQYLFLQSSSPVQSGVVGDAAAGSLLLQFFQGSLSFEQPASRSGRYLYAIVPEGLSMGAATVRAKTVFSGSGAVAISNPVAFTVNSSPGGPTVRGASIIGAEGGAVFADSCYAPGTVEFPTTEGANLVRIRQGGAVYEVEPTMIETWRMFFPKPPGLLPGVAEVSVVSTYGGVAAGESNRVATDVLSGPPVLTSLSSSVALAGQHLWAFGSGFSRAFNSVAFYQGEGPFVYATSCGTNQADAVSFEVPLSLAAGTYQVTVWHEAGETARLTLAIGSAAAPVQVLSCPSNLGARERFAVRVSGMRANTSVRISQGETSIGSGSVSAVGLVRAGLSSGAPPGPGSVVLTTDVGGTEPVVTTQAFSVSLSPDPPILSPSFFLYGVPMAGGGQYVRIEASSINTSTMTAEITQGGAQVLSSSVWREVDSVNVILPGSLATGPATVRVKAMYNGVETGWSNSVPVWISDQLLIAGCESLSSVMVPGKPYQLTTPRIVRDAEVQMVLSGRSGEWAVDQFHIEWYGLGTFALPSGMPAGLYLCRVRTKPAGALVFSAWGGSVLVEVSPGPVSNAPLTLGDDDSIEIPFAAGFTFPFTGQSWDRLRVSSNGGVTFGGYQGRQTDYGYLGYLLTGPPRIAPLWTDLYPMYDGSVRFEQHTSWLDVIYEGVPEWAVVQTESTARVRLFPDGRFDFIYGEVQLNLPVTVGFGPGGEAGDPGETDFSSLDLTRSIGTGTESSIYEELDGPAFDLDNLTLHFAANGRQATGYTILGTDGGVFAFGGSEFYGSLPAIGLVPNAPLSNLTLTTSEQGYYMMGLDGGVFCFGDAQFLGSLPGLGISNQTIDLEAVPGGQGYYLLGPDGGVFAFGTAEFHGSLPGVGVVNTALDMEITPSGQGYWILGIDGGIFAFGDAQFYGSLPQLGVAPVAPLKRIKSTPDGRGYCLLGEDGGVFAFGNANFWGSLPSLGVVNQAVDLEITPNNQGYYMLGVDGGIFSFGDAGFFGSLPGMGIATTTLDMEVKTNR